MVLLQLCIKLKRNAEAKTMCLGCPVPVAVCREAAGPVSLSEKKKCRFSSLCQEEQGVIWDRELFCGVESRHEGAIKVLPQHPHQGRMEIKPR